MLALGMLAALVERDTSGKGQVIDAAMVEGSALLATAFLGFLQNGTWSPERGTNIVDSGAPFYDAGVEQIVDAEHLIARESFDALLASGAVRHTAMESA